MVKIKLLLHYILPIGNRFGQDYKFLIMETFNKKILYLLLLSIVFFIADTAGQTKSISDSEKTKLASQYFLKADSLSKLNENDSAIAYIKKSSDLYRELESWNKLISCLYALARNCSMLGDNECSISASSEGINILSEKYKNDTLLYKFCNGLGYDLYGIGKYKEAIQYLEKSLHIQNNILDSTHISHATSYNNLGNVYYIIGNIDKAFYFYHKALVIANNSFIKQKENVHVIQTVIKTYNNLGCLYIDKGDLDMAMKQFNIALNSFKQLTNYSSEDIMINYSIYQNMGIIYTDKEDFETALLYYFKAISIFTKLLSANHYYLSETYRNIGISHLNKKSYPEAMYYFNKAADLTKSELPENSPQNITSKLSIAAVLQSMGNYDSAGVLYKNALKSYNEIFGEVHPSIAACNINLGILNYEINNFSSAFDYLEKALSMYKEIFGDNHPLVGSSYIELGNLFLKKKEFSAALEHYHSALSALVKNFKDKNVYANPVSEHKLSQESGTVVNNMHKLLVALTGKAITFEYLYLSQNPK